jgi:hypothetical protein
MLSRADFEAQSKKWNSIRGILNFSRVIWASELGERWQMNSSRHSLVPCIISELILNFGQFVNWELYDRLRLKRLTDEYKDYHWSNCDVLELDMFAITHRDAGLSRWVSLLDWERRDRFYHVDGRSVTENDRLIRITDIPRIHLKWEWTLRFGREPGWYGLELFQQFGRSLCRFECT